MAMLASSRAGALRLPSNGSSIRSSAPGLLRQAGMRRLGVVSAALPDPDHLLAAANSIGHIAHAHFNPLAHLAEDAQSIADSVAGAAASPAVAAASAAATAAGAVASDKGSGPFDWLAIGFENVLEFLDGVLVKANVPYSYGFAIILLTILVKVATFPLSQKQVASTVALQALQPRVKELQAKYAGDQDTLNLEIAKLYRDAGVNPLAGCLPTLATIPVFIGLYRALTLAAEDNLLNDPFFWIPSLGGPATLAQQQNGTGLSWLFPFVDGHPPIGWGAAGAYLVLPVLLVVSQYVSQRIISPPSNDPAQAQSQAILKFLPLMIGWFSLNVPAGLTLYWFVNNIFSTAQQVYLKNTIKVNIPESSGSSSGNGVTSSSTPYIAPKEEKVKKVTGKDTNARRRKSDDGTVDVEAEVLPSTTNGSSTPSPAPQKNSKGEKFRAKKAREAASKAAAVAGTTNSSSSNGSGAAESSAPKSE